MKWVYDEHEFIEKIVEEEGLSVKTLLGEAGDLVLADIRGIHRGMPLIKGKRYALFNYFYSKHNYNKTLR